MDDEVDEFAAGVAELDQEPIPGLGEIPDCDDDAEDCQIVGPSDAGGQE
jgi:hypothetical protein